MWTLLARVAEDKYCDGAEASSKKNYYHVVIGYGARHNGGNCLGWRGMVELVGE